MLSRCSCLLMSPQSEIPHGHAGRGRALETHEGQHSCSEGLGWADHARGGAGRK